jgi:UDP-3-O-[3-hydroxymyristoyl] glucosamine N-acyltransferase
MKLSELAARLSYYCAGENDIEVCSIKIASKASQNDIAIARSRRDIHKTAARVVLTTPIIEETDKTLLFCHDAVDFAAVKIAKLLIQAGSLPDYSAPITYAQQSGMIMTGKECSIGNGTAIAPFCTLGDHVVIGENCVIESGVWIGSDVRIGDNVVLHSGVKIGAPSFYHYGEEDLRSFTGIGTVYIDDNVEIGCNTVIERGAFSDSAIGCNTKIGDLVNVGHDVCIGQNCKIVSQVGIAGEVAIGNYVRLFGQVGVANHITIDDYATVMAKSSVIKNVSRGKCVSGRYTREHMEELRLQVKIKKMQEVQ